MSPELYGLESPDAQSDILTGALREVNLLSQLRHENVVQMLGVVGGGEGNTFPLWVVFERATHSLDKHLSTAAVCRWDIWRLLVDTLTGVCFLHERGVMHRDLKPGNVLVFVGADGVARAKVADVGEAKQDSAANSIHGSPWYMAPEAACAGATGMPSRFEERVSACQ